MLSLHLSFWLLVVEYQSVIIVPPRASVDIKGATDKTLRDALHKKPFTLTLIPSLFCGLRISLSEIPLLESFEKIPGLVFSPVIGFVTVVFFEQDEITKIKIISASLDSAC